MNIPMLPGMGVEKEDSDSDEEAVAAREKRKAEAAAREARDEAAQREAAKRAAAAKAAMADKELLLQALCPADGQVDKVVAHLAEVRGPRPDDFEERLLAASELRERGKGKFQTADHQAAAMLWLCAVYCLDFTPNQFAAMADATAELRTKELSAPILSNLTIALRKTGDIDGSLRSADVGLRVAQELPYQDSKAVRVKLRFNRALARSEQRDFAKAAEDFGHVLQLDAQHEEAKNALRNCEAALRREAGPEERRWRGPITVRLKTSKDQPWWSARWKLLLGLAIGPLLAYTSARMMR